MTSETSSYRKTEKKLNSSYGAVQRKNRSEAAFKVVVKAFLKTLPQCWNVKVQQIGLRGTPDILCCLKGRFVALELKGTEKANVAPLQEHTIEQISLAGGYARIVSPETWEGVKRELKEF